MNNEQPHFGQQLREGEPAGLWFSGTITAFVCCVFVLPHVQIGVSESAFYRSDRTDCGLRRAGKLQSGISVRAVYAGHESELLFVLFTVPTGIFGALILVSLTHNRFRGMRVFQFVFSAPVVLSVGSSAVIWKFLFHPTLGMLNYLLGRAGIDPIPWLISPDWALISISIMTIWMNLGFNYIILSSGLQGIPDEIYESARMDGAGALLTFRKISMPSLSPTLFFVTVVSIIGAFQSFGQINILTRGGPMDSTNVFVYSIYQEAFVNFRFGTGSAQALILFAVIMPLTLLQFKWVERKVHYQ